MNSLTLAIAVSAIAPISPNPDPVPIDSMIPVGDPLLGLTLAQVRQQVNPRFSSYMYGGMGDLLWVTFRQEGITLRFEKDRVTKVIREAPFVRTQHP